MAKLPDPSTIADALATMADKELTLSQIESLSRILIKKEELDIYKTMTSTTGDWDKTEKFLIEINEIPNHKEKLQIWLLIKEFEELFPSVEESLEYLVDACQEISNNKYFRDILAIILGLGNILNGGTIKGQADGFSLDLLPKLVGIKDSLGNSLLTWVCSKEHKDDESFEGLKGQFPALEKAVDFSLDETKRKVSSLENMVKQIDASLKTLSANDEFKRKAIDSLSEIKEKYAIVSKRSKDNSQYYEDIVKYFGITKKEKYYTQNELFFKMLLCFFDDIDKSMPKLDVKRVMDSQSHVVGKKVDQNALMSNLMTQLKQKVQN